MMKCELCNADPMTANCNNANCMTKHTDEHEHKYRGGYDLNGDGYSLPCRCGAVPTTQQTDEAPTPYGHNPFNETDMKELTYTQLVQFVRTYWHSYIGYEEASKLVEQAIKPYTEKAVREAYKQGLAVGALDTHVLRDRKLNQENIGDKV